MLYAPTPQRTLLWSSILILTAAAKLKLVSPRAMCTLFPLPPAPANTLRVDVPGEWFKLPLDPPWLPLLLPSWLFLRVDIPVEMDGRPSLRAL